MTAAIPLVWTDAHRLHEPGAEIWVGVRTPAVEVPERADAIRVGEACAAAGLPDGVVGLVHLGAETGRALAEANAID